jgi:hypothetical protein
MKKSKQKLIKKEIVFSSFVVKCLNNFKQKFEMRNFIQ